MSEGTPVILCIDDDPDVLESLRLVLEHRNCVVRTANSGQAGLQAYQAEKPDLVIVDLMMEEADSGLAFVQNIRALGATTPVYMLSSVGDALTQNIDFSQLDLTGVLQKPVVPEMLLKIVDHVLKKG